MIKNKTCIVCKIVFTPYNSLQRVCGNKCAYEFGKAQRLKGIAIENKKKLGLLKYKSELLSEFQVIFNKYIRLRDKGKTCISCNAQLNDKHDAGHCFSVGSYPNIRFHEDNVHAQCVHCNRHKHGNQAEYLINLPERIGNERFNQLLENRKNTLHLSKEDIEELKITYQKKIKELNAE